MTWKPEGTVQLVAGTPPGGGLDRVARALEQAIAAAKLLDVPVEVLNVPGDGARKCWTDFVDKHQGDAHVLGISSPNMVSDYLVGIATFEHSKYVPVATLVTEYIAFAVRTDSDLKTGKDLLARLGRAPGEVRVALSTALGNPNHVALAKLTRQQGGDINAPVIGVFDTALDAVAAVTADTADVCAVTAASVLAEQKAGRVRVLAITAPERLSGAFANTPTWNELGADCVIGAWRGVTGPTGMTAEQAAFWSGILEAATKTQTWHDELARLSWSPQFQAGAELDAALASERAEFVAVLGDLGLLKNR